MAPLELDFETLKALRAAHYHRNLKVKREAYSRHLSAKEERRAEREQHKATAEWPPARSRSTQAAVTQARPPHGAGRAAARTLLAHGDLEAVSDMPSVVAGCSGLSNGEAATRKARVAPQLKSTKSTAWRIDEEVDMEKLKKLFYLPVKKYLDDSIEDFNVEKELRAMRRVLAAEAQEAEIVQKAEAEDTKTTQALLRSIEDTLAEVADRAQLLLGSALETEEADEDWEVLVANLARKDAKTKDTSTLAEDDTWSILA